LEIEELRDGDGVVLAPRGSLTAAAACATLEKRLAALLQDRVRFYVLDGRELTALGSAALRALLRLQRSLRPLQGRLVFCSLDARLRETLAVAGFERDFALAANRQAALAQLQADATPGPELGPALLAALSAGRPALSARLRAEGRIDPRLGELLKATLAGAGHPHP